MLLKGGTPAGMALKLATPAGGTGPGGIPMSGEQAKEFGLVDEIGGFQDALKLAKNIAGLPENSTVEMILPRLTLVERLGISFGALSFFKNSALDSKLSGIPLWLMPRF